MCGICGIFDRGAAGGDRLRRVERMSRALAHRGPDDAGSYEADEISLGFRRLAVIDLETGRQPIRLEDDRAVIVLNGEIYNFKELRRDLEPRHRFRSKGDVEVVLRLYAEKGTDALRELRGMFALAIWDRERRTLLLARDRFGIKPLYLCQEGGAIAFASEVSGLLAGGFPGRASLDRIELRHYLAQRYLSPGSSILEGVRSLPPATALEISSSGAREFRYWEPDREAAANIEEGEAADRLETLLQNAVTRQLVADVPVGVFLSGGLDSSALTAMVREGDPSSLRTFSVGFEGDGATSELPWAREVARWLGTDHHELRMDAREVARDLDRILASLDGPLGDATAIPTWYMSRLARQRVTVALSGEGADELFGGYPRQRYDVAMDRLPGIGRRLLPLGLRAAGKPVSQRLRARLGMESGLTRQLDWSRIFTAKEIDSLSLEPLPTEREMFDRDARVERRWRETAERDPINARLEADRELFLPGDLLPKVDRMSMAHSLEVRVPYLDEDLAEFVIGLPGTLKVGPREGKALLRRVARRLLPPRIVKRRKQGFDVPIGAWLRGPLRDPLIDYLSEETTRRRKLFRPERVRALVREHLEGEAEHGDALWTLLALEGWQQRVLDRATRVPA